MAGTVGGAVESAVVLEVVKNAATIELLNATSIFLGNLVVAVKFNQIGVCVSVGTSRVQYKTNRAA